MLHFGVWLQLYTVNSRHVGRTSGARPSSHTASLPLSTQNI